MPGIRSTLVVTFAVLFFSAMITIVLETGNNFWQPTKVANQWESGEWLGTSERTDAIYLRKRFILARTPYHAQLKLAAVDEFEVFVNGQMVGRARDLGHRPSAVYDVADLLNIGENIIAIKALSHTKGSSAQVSAALYWSDLSGPRELSSDGSWRVSTRGRWQRRGLVRWHDLRFDDSHWAAPSIITGARKAAVLPHELPMKVLQQISPEYWMWGPEQRMNTVSLRRRFHISDPSINGAWLGVGVSGEFILKVNGYSFESDRGINDKIKLFNIAPYILSGTNEVAIRVSNVSKSRIMLAGVVDGERGLTYFSADELWRVAPGNDPVTLIRNTETHRPKILLSALDPPAKFKVEIWKSRLSVFSLVIIIVAFVGALFVMVCHRRQRVRVEQLCNIYVHPYVLAGLLLMVAFLVDKDVRFDLSFFFSFWIPLAAAILIVFWLLFATFLITSNDQRRDEVTTLS